MKPLPRGAWHRAGTLLLFIVGSVGAFAPLLDGLRLLLGPLILVVTAAYVLARLPAGGRVRRVVRVVAVTVSVLAHALWGVELVAFTVELSWTVSVLVWALAGMTLLASLLSSLRRWGYLEVPLVVPVGIVVVACLRGWEFEEAQIRCDDYITAVAQDSLRVVVPTTDELLGCVPGDRLEIARFPRHFWEAPEGGRYVFTSQNRNPGHAGSDPPPGRISGAICVARSGDVSPPECLGLGVAQAISEDPGRDQLFIGSWETPGVGAITVVPRSGPLRVVNQVATGAKTGELFYDPVDDLVHAVSDEGELLFTFDGDDLSPLRSVSTPVLPGDTVYDQRRREGVFCFAAGPFRTIDGGGYAAVAFRTGPYELWPLAPTARYPWLWLGFSWGCDFDLDRRRVWVALANLPVLLTIDFDTGEILGTSRVGFGTRSVEYDPSRQRLFSLRYLSGEVTEIDVESGDELRSWFVGRFARLAQVSRDERRLIVTSNLGIVEIELEPADKRANDRR